MLELKQKVKIIKIDKYVPSNCLGKVGIIEQVIDCGGKFIYDVNVADYGLVTFLEEDLVKV